jgi:hypothetical protein
MVEGDSRKIKLLHKSLAVVCAILAVAAAIAVVIPKQPTQHRLQFMTTAKISTVVTYTTGTNHILHFRNGFPMDNQRLGKTLVWINMKLRCPIFRRLMVIGYNPAVSVYIWRKDGTTPVPFLAASLVSPSGKITLCDRISELGGSRAYTFPLLPRSTAGYCLVIADSNRQLVRIKLDQ